jgi:gas vesicle protein
MKMSLVAVIASLLVFSSLSIAHDRKDDCDGHHRDEGFLHDCDVDWNEEDGTLIISNEADEDEVVEITKGHKLFVNGERVEIDREQKKLVSGYYKNMKKLHDLAEEIGAEGAKLGEKGGKIAEVALKNICKLLGDKEDSEEFEAEIEREAEKLEAEAEKLEEKAAVLEDVVEDLEDLHYEMKDAVPALKGLDWF